MSKIAIILLLSISTGLATGCGSTRQGSPGLEPSGIPESEPASEEEQPAGPFTLILSPTRESVALGENIDLRCDLINTSEETLRTKQLAHDVQSLSFETEWGGSPFEFARANQWGGGPREWETVELPPGESVSETFSIPTLIGGQVKVRGIYRGAGDFPIASNAIEIRVESARDGDEVLAALDTNFGVVKIRFYPLDAPNTALHFLDLVGRGFYDDISFHRIIKGFVIQGGDPGGGGPGYTLNSEFNQRKHLPGHLSMARTEDPDSAGSQFFICLGAAPHLDGAYTVFGEVASGFDEVIRKIESSVELHEGTTEPIDDVYIKKATIVVEPLES